MSIPGTTPPPGDAARSSGAAVPPGPATTSASILAALPHRSIADLALRGELPATTEGLAIGLVMRLGDLMAASGLSVNDTIATMRRVCDAYGLTRAQIDITTYKVTVSYYPGGGVTPVTAMRTVSPAIANLSQVAAANHLVSRIVAGLSLDDAIAQFDALRVARTPYPAWVAWVAAGSISVAVQLLFTTSPRLLLVAWITGILLNRFLALLAHFDLPPFFRQLLGGWFVVGLAVLFSWINRTGHPGFLAGLSPTLVAVGCVYQLVVGMKFVGAMQDAIDGFHVTASARLLQVAMETGGIVVGLVTGLSLATYAGEGVHLAATMANFGPLPAQYIGAGLLAVVFVMGSYADLPTIVLSGGASLLAWFGFTVSAQAGAGPVLANFAGAVAAAFAATLIVRRTRLPGFAAVNAAIVALVPGLRLYYGVVWLVGTPTMAADTATGWSYIGLAAAISLAIAAGASLGTYIGRPIGDRVMDWPAAWYARLRGRHDGDTG